MYSNTYVKISTKRHKSNQKFSFERIYSEYFTIDCLERVKSTVLDKHD